MRLNKTAKSNLHTAEGAPAHIASVEPMNALRRSVLSCLLWEDEFYVDGIGIADYIGQAVRQVANKYGPEPIAKLAIEARHKYNLRHVPLWLLVHLAPIGAGIPGLVKNTVLSVINRPDEITELLALYWKDGKKPLPAGFKKGLARAFNKFDEYQIAKYNRKEKIKLRDVMFLVHGKSMNPEQGKLIANLVNKTFYPEFTKSAGFKVKENYGLGDKFEGLKTPDTWEVGLTTGKDKKETFERLLSEKKLGYLALLRNLRLMTEAGVDDQLIRDAILERRGANRVLPFRFIAAANACPRMEHYLDMALVENIQNSPPLEGTTVVLVDVSYSMQEKLSKRSDLRRVEAAAVLGSIINGNCRVFTFSESCVEVPPRHGMAGVDSIINSQLHNGTWLGSAVDKVNRLVKYDRIIVITDEQSHDRVPDPISDKAYMINIASYLHGVGYGKWTHIDGFAEAVLIYIQELESMRESADH